MQQQKLKDCVAEIETKISVLEQRLESRIRDRCSEASSEVQALGMELGEKLAHLSAPFRDEIERLALLLACVHEHSALASTEAESEHRGYLFTNAQRGAFKQVLQ